MTKDMDLFDLLYVLAKRKRFVLIFTLIFAIGAIVYSLVAEKYWVSKAVIVPLADSSTLSGLDTGLMGIIGQGILGDMQKDPSLEFVTIMQSRTFREKVIKKFDLIRYFKKTHLPYDEALELSLFKLANSVVKITVDEESKLVTIRVETKDKLFSKAMAQYYLDELQTYLRTIRGSKSKRERLFLEQQVLTTRAEIDSLAILLRDFQKKNNTIELDKQTSALVTLYSESIAEYYKVDIEYEVAKQQYQNDSPVLKELSQRRNILKGKIKELEKSNSGLVPEYVLQIDRIPDLTLQLAQLTLNLQIKKTIFEYLYPQYEIARLDELRDMPDYDVLDSPSLAGLRSKPKRAVLVIVITFMALMLGSFLAVVKENLLVVHRDKFDSIKAAFKARKSKPDQQP